MVSIFEGLGLNSFNISLWALFVAHFRKQSSIIIHEGKTATMNDDLDDGKHRSTGGRKKKF